MPGKELNSVETKKYIGTNPLMWLVVIVLAFLAIGQFRQAKADESAARQSYVQSACDSARQSGSFADCYAAENTANAEYLCNSSQDCWTELK